MSPLARRLLAPAGAALLLAGPPARGQRDAGSDPAGDIVVQCAGAARTEPCAADTATYIGWRVFEAECVVCHARGGVGSTFAPALGPRIRRMDWAAFVEMLKTGYRGARDALPPHGERENVARYYRELWRYLVARADGRLPAAAPVERLPEAE